MILSRSWTLIVSHRKGLAEFGLAAIGLVLAGFIALSIDLGGQLSTHQQIELLEVLGLGLLTFVGFGWVMWRRLADQEREIRQRIEAEERARFLAHHDHLTGLPNRRQLQSALEAASTIPPSAERTHAVFLLDLNGFKKVNDVYGHARGDEVLSSAAARITGALSPGDLLARTGGDEFAIVARDLSGVDGAAATARKILSSLEEPIVIRPDQHQIGTGIGIAMVPRDGTEPSEMLRRADVALYKAKAAEGSAFAFFEDEMDREVRRRGVLQRDLGRAIGTDAIVPHFQPIVDLETGAVRAFEALARWTHPEFGAIAPDRFIPIAEESGLIADLSDHLLLLACETARSWPAHIELSFNVSPLLLRDPGFGLRVLGIIGRAGLVPSRLELEITENAIVRDLEGARDTLGPLRDAGVRIALDDFGTGSTSLFHLRSLKFDVLKIDRSFIELMNREPQSAQIIKAILGLGRGLGVEIIAEGIEEASQLSSLKEHGCREGQGFLFGRAVAGSETLAMLKQPRAGSAPEQTASPAPCRISGAHPADRHGERSEPVAFPPRRGRVRQPATVEVP
jgi:diguanylate cyclase (GGDEF)-like protein